MVTMRDDSVHKIFMDRGMALFIPILTGEDRTIDGINATVRKAIEKGGADILRGYSFKVYVERDRENMAHEVHIKFRVLDEELKRANMVLQEGSLEIE